MQYLLPLPRLDLAHCEGTPKGTARVRPGRFRSFVARFFAGSAINLNLHQVAEELELIGFYGAETLELEFSVLGGEPVLEFFFAQGNVFFCGGQHLYSWDFSIDTDLHGRGACAAVTRVLVCAHALHGWKGVRHFCYLCYFCYSRAEVS